MNKLAIKGGNKLIKKKKLNHTILLEREREIVNRIVSSGKLSEFFGVWGAKVFMVENMFKNLKMIVKNFLKSNIQLQ